MSETQNTGMLAMPRRERNFALALVAAALLAMGGLITLFWKLAGHLRPQRPHTEPASPDGPGDPIVTEYDPSLAAVSDAPRGGDSAKSRADQVQTVSIALIAFILVAATVVLHTVGLVAVLMVLLAKHARAPTRFWPMTVLLIEVAWILVLIHAIEIGFWALFYLWAGCLPDAESAFYFSGVTYATIGYGDVVLPQPWRLLGPLEGLTGILMCGLSTGLFFAIITRLIGSRLKAGNH